MLPSDPPQELGLTTVVLITGIGCTVKLIFCVLVQPVVVFLIVIVPLYVPAATDRKLPIVIGLDAKAVFPTSATPAVLAAAFQSMLY